MIAHKSDKSSYHLPTKPKLVSSNASPESIRVVLRPRCRVKILMDERVSLRKSLVQDVIVLFSRDHVGERLRYDAMLLATEPGECSVLRDIFESWAAEQDVQPRSWLEQEIERARYSIQRIEWIDKSLATRPAQNRKVITVNKNTQSLIGTARARRLMVKAKKAFEVTSDTEVLKKAALLVAFSEGETGGGVAIAAAIIESAAGSPTEGLLDELAALEEMFEKLGARDEE